MIDRFHIVSEIKRTASANGGVPLGQRQFESATGIKRSDWRDKYWARWGDALIEAGFPANTPPDRIDEAVILKKLMDLAEKLDRFPTRDEIRLEKRSCPGFPSMTIITKRIGPRADQLRKLYEFSKESGNSSVAAICKAELSYSTEEASQIETSTMEALGTKFGFVYLLKSGKYYKIGRTMDLGRREYELGIQLPEKPIKIHSIKTDDPVGTERYWHERFKDRRKNGEWFELTKDDVTAFKRRKFM